MKTLILGGTNEDRDPIELLMTDGHEVTASLTGRARRPARIVGEVWVGDFGGTNGLAAWLVGDGTDRVVDAIRPSAEQINTNAVAACQSVGAPLLWTFGLSWVSHPLADTWTWVASHDDASWEAAGHKKVLLAVGRQLLDHYWNLSDVVTRTVRFPEELLPDSWWLLLERDPFIVDSEEELLRDLGVDVLVAKNSGGSLTEAELTATADLGVRVIMVHHAPIPKDVSQMATPQEILAWVSEVPA